MIYLDHAATSYPKPPGVVAAVTRWFEDVGVSPARGDGARCRLASAITTETRTALARLCGVPRERVVFTSGATEAANLFLHGLLGDGETVVTTAAEHSAVARPLRTLQDHGRIRVHVVAVDGEGRVDVDDVRAALDRHAPRLLALNHASNVTGAVQDAAALCRLARECGALTLLDASQTAGVLPLNHLGADAVIASAHKALHGPPGLGFLAVGAAVTLRSVKQGGTGSSRALDRQPETWPIGFEPGTPNTPAIAGLGAAMDWLEHAGAASLHAHGLQLIDTLRRGLAERLAERVRLIGPAAGPRIALLSFTLSDLDPAEAGMILDAADVHVRTGFHCAPWIHAHLGTETSGTIRVSPGPFVTADDILEVARVLAR